jgi:TolA-binding protein
LRSRFERRTRIGVGRRAAAPLDCGSFTVHWLEPIMMSTSARVSFALALLGLSSAGCLVTQKDHEAVSARAEQAEKQAAAARAEVAMLRADLEATRQRLDNALRANADSSTETMSTKQRLNDLAGRVDEANHGVEELRRDVNASRTEIYARIDDLRRTQQAAPAPPPVQVPSDKPAHYKQIEDAYAKKDWGTVRALAPEYVNRYPSDEKADEALFYAGDADINDGRPSSALGNFNRLLKLFPRSNVLDRTLYGMGEAYMMMHDCANAKLAYEACERRFAKDKVGADSRAKLQVIAKNAPGTCAP